MNWTTQPRDGWHWHRIPGKAPWPCLVKTLDGVPQCMLWRTRSWVLVADVLGEWSAFEPAKEPVLRGGL